MAYREDLDALAQQRASEDTEAALFASFRLAERARRRRTLAKCFGVLVVICAIYGGSLAAPLPAHGSAAVLVRLHDAAIRDAANEARHECARRAMHEWREWSRDPSAAIAQGDPHPHYKLEDFAKSCERESNNN
jgi:hypothetical protein